MRLFTATLLSEEIKEHLYNTAQRIVSSGVACRCSAKDNLHLTLIFLGEHDNKELINIKSAMDSVKSDSFTLSIAGLGSFRKSRGSVVWAGTHSGSALSVLRSLLKLAFEDKGFAIEDKFTPHITLCRQAQGPLPSLGKTEEDTGEMSMKVNRISLMKSERINGALLYTEIYSTELN